MRSKIRIGALISGGGTNLQAIIDACEAGTIDGRIVFVGADTPAAKGLERAKRHGIPTFMVDYGDIIRRCKETPEALTLPADGDIAAIMAKQSLLGPTAPAEKARLFIATRMVAEAGLLAAMAEYRPDLLVLAGFMRNLTPYFIDRFNTDPGYPRIMNIHPALLPAFPGVDGYGDTFRYGCKVGGCTVHFIDYGEDSGPIIGQRSFVIEESDTLESVKKKGLALEWQLYPQCIQWFAENRLQVVTMTYTLDDGRIAQRRVVRVAQPEK
ncbi:MAG: phosphoribosylglycinamide formyltransferase [Desulfobacterales bacterium]|nr:phosphoribosylglycinamide formyltransferase [Desulfobacterales bacterium]